ncbi:hypothetical protein ACFFP0_28070 [Rhizobium puerariae]|uniref:Uncharacterized protein n=1 Tax=Rhizobium puerariae TaxID=1585791 RepID=A0ABV6AQ13_9HYPH
MNNEDEDQTPPPDGIDKPYPKYVEAPEFMGTTSRAYELSPAEERWLTAKLERLWEESGALGDPASTSTSDKKRSVRWMPLLRQGEEAATREPAQVYNRKSVVGSADSEHGHKDRTGKDGLASPGVARTILRLLKGNDISSDATNDEQ